MEDPASSKDVKALMHTGIDNDFYMEVIEAVERVNEKQKSIVYDKIIKAVGDMYDAADGADVFSLMTEWRQFRMPSWNVIKKVMTGNVVVDGRNIFDRKELEELGFVYTRIGEK